MCVRTVCPWLLDVVGFPLGVHGEPALSYTLMLCDYFADAPEGGTGQHAQYDAGVFIGGIQAEGSEYDAHGQKGPPDAFAEIVLRLDDEGVKEADGQKRDPAYDKSDVVHIEKM